MKKDQKQTSMFTSKTVPAKDGSGKLFEEEVAPNEEPVTCLGMEFANDEERRRYFTEQLREKLKDPEFRKIEGFPHGEDEDILALSDPPYYTACPNPWISDFIIYWEQDKLQGYGDSSYTRKPYTLDVEEGRSGLFYDAHSYHTKVPHKAIMRYILHYTNPGDIVFDGFCGTGMTGVAAQMCADENEVKSLGYKVDNDGSILKEVINEHGKKEWQKFSYLGKRNCLLNELSSYASFISYNYNRKDDIDIFYKEMIDLLHEVEDELGWLYETLHSDGKSKGSINYTIWSDVFICPNCGSDIIFWDSFVCEREGGVKSESSCSECESKVNKRILSRKKEKVLDKYGDDIKSINKITPVLINYTYSGKRFEKRPDSKDIDNISYVKSKNFSYWFPVDKIPNGDKTSEPIRYGINRVCDFYLKRNLIMLSALRDKAKKKKSKNRILFSINSYDLSHSTIMTRVIFKKNNKKPVLTSYQSGTLYVPSLPVEKNIIKGIRQQKLPIIYDSFKKILNDQVVSTQSSTFIGIEDETVDYIFLDPPFGSNIMYSELNYLVEAWSKVKTNVEKEAIENKAQRKGNEDYRKLMLDCFNEAYRVLKPGRWMTMEFSNTKSSVWNSIQLSLSEAGFIIANVSALDKKQGSFNAVTNSTSVKKDLIISAYKPYKGLVETFDNKAKTEEGVWEFIRTHLKFLPITKLKDGNLQFIPERDPRILFDQMVAFYVQKGYTVPLSSREFQDGLAKRFDERDGMYFLSDQAAEYDKKKMISEEVVQTNLFVSDESSAIQWLRQVLKLKPQTFADINPQFMQQLGGWNKNEKQLDLRELLNQNFLSYDGKGPVPEQIHAYLSSNWKEFRNLSKDDPKLKEKAKDRWYVPDPTKAGDLEKLRERALLKEFDEYKQAKKKLKVFRLEAVRAGFKKAWQERDYQTIIKVADKIPDKILEEDPKLLMWYDQALTRTGEE